MVKTTLRELESRDDYLSDFFFFQAEDGIRDKLVTGVQTCALRSGTTAPDGKPGRAAEREIRWSMPVVSEDGKLVVASARSGDNKDRWFVTLDRSEERRVGKECSARRWA